MRPEYHEIPLFGATVFEVTAWMNTYQDNPKMKERIAGSFAHQATGDFTSTDPLREMLDLLVKGGVEFDYPRALALAIAYAGGRKEYSPVKAVPYNVYVEKEGKKREAMKEQKIRHFMHVNTGSVDTEENWRADSWSQEEPWDFDSQVRQGNLVEVVQVSGEWVPAENGDDQ